LIISKISENAYSAFKNKRRFRSPNTDVLIDNDGEVYMYLFNKEKFEWLGEWVNINNLPD